jgi:hypothetical protein
MRVAAAAAAAVVARQRASDNARKGGITVSLLQNGIIVSLLFS